MKKITTFEKHLDKQYGKKGTDRRDKFEADSIVFRWEKCLRKKERKQSYLVFASLAVLG